MEKCKNHCMPVYYKRHRRCGFNPWVGKTPWRRKWQPTSQNYGFSSSHVQMWELDHNEGWAPKNWCFPTVILEKTLENPLDCKKIRPVNPKGNQPLIFIGRTDAEAETPILWPPDDAGKGWRQEEKGMIDDMTGWHHPLDGYEFEQAPGVGDGQGSLECCSPLFQSQTGLTTELNWTESLVLNNQIFPWIFKCLHMYTF